MKTILVALVLTGLSVTAMATVPGYPACQLSYHSDSYGLGAKSAFDNSYPATRYLDHVCFNLGRDAALKAMEEAQSSCAYEYKNGFPEGSNATAYNAGTPCYWLGYKAGIAVLGLGAREGLSELVGEECVSAYKRGQTESREGRASGPGNVSNKGSYCYQLGTYEVHL